MTPKQRTLLIIGGFVVFMIGTFIWFVATWDPSVEEPVSAIPSEEPFA